MGNERRGDRWDERVEDATIWIWSVGEAGGRGR